jgi:hypothetical protein
MRRTIIAFMIVALIISCKSKEKEIISLPEMKLVMWDMLNADALYNQIIIKDSTARINKENLRFYQDVFNIHHITKERFYNSYRFYASHPDNMKILIDSLNAYGGRMRAIEDSIQMRKDKAAPLAIKPDSAAKKLKAIDPVP